VYRFELDNDGTLRNRRVFLRFRPDERAPDGMTVDSEGALFEIDPQVTGVAPNLFAR
jgi:sugar lactone lactonase YvrE